MSDERLRALERKWDQTRAVSDLEALVHERARVGWGQERFLECRELLTKDIDNTEVRCLLSRHDPLAWTGFATIEYHSLLGGRNQESWTSLFIREGNHPAYTVRIERRGNPRLIMIDRTLHYTDSEKRLRINDTFGVMREPTYDPELYLYQRSDGQPALYRTCTGHYFSDEGELPGAPVRLLPDGPVFVGLDENGQPYLTMRSHGIGTTIRGPIIASDGKLYHRPRSCFMNGNKRVRTRQARHERLPEAMRYFRQENQAATTLSLESVHAPQGTTDGFQAVPTMLELPINVLNALRSIPDGVYR